MGKNNNISRNTKTIYTSPYIDKQLILTEGNITAESTQLHVVKENVEVEDWTIGADIPGNINW